MTLQENKQLARVFLEHAYANRMEAALALLTQDASWWVLGDPAQLRVAGERDVAGIERLLRGIARAVPGGMRPLFHAITAEEDRVAVEAEAHADFANGKPFHNRYHFLIRVREGAICEVREYMDTLHAYQISQV